MAKRRLCLGPAGVISCTPPSALSCWVSLFPGECGCNRTCVLCIGKWFLNLWTTGELLHGGFTKTSCQCPSADQDHLINWLLRQNFWPRLHRPQQPGLCCGSWLPFHCFAFQFLDSSPPRGSFQPWWDPHFPQELSPSQDLYSLPPHNLLCHFWGPSRGARARLTCVSSRCCLFLSGPLTLPP